MIVITGTSGFIGSNLVCELLQCGYKDLVCVDLPGKTDNSLYLSDKKRLKYVDNDKLVSFLQNNFRLIQMVIHLGACSDTTETKQQVFEELNINYSKTLWNFCAQFGLPLIYASSGATYGDGLAGYSDNHACVRSYKPLNLYGWSKQVFDEWVLDQQNSPFYWVGLKFFNVYGPNEHHKGAMSSVVLKAFNQIKREGYVTLFKSHNPEYKDGEQIRDFVYVRDVCKAIIYFIEHRTENGLYNIGTGAGRTFKDLVKGVFAALDQPEKITFIDTPVNIRNKYQYFTEADITKLRSAGYTHPFASIEEGICDYVQNFLTPQKFK